MAAFHEVRFPDDISRGVLGGPGRRTDIVTLVSGFEERNAAQAHSKRRYDAAYGIRRADDMAAVVAFWEARLGQLHGFRWKDWSDHKSCLPSQAPSATDQLLGDGDGSATAFQLVKHYSSGPTAYVRPIRKPVAGTVRVALGGVAQASGWSLDPATGMVSFASPPAAGQAVTAGFESTCRSGSTSSGWRSRSTSSAPGRSPRSRWWRSGYEGDPERAAEPSRQRRHHHVLLLAGHPDRRPRPGLHRARRGPALRRDDVPGGERVLGQPSAAVAGAGGRQPEHHRGAVERRNQRGRPGRRALRRRLRGALLGELARPGATPAADGRLHRRGEAHRARVHRRAARAREPAQPGHHPHLPAHLRRAARRQPLQGRPLLEQIQGHRRDRGGARTAHHAGHRPRRLRGRLVQPGGVQLRLLERGAVRDLEPGADRECLPRRGGARGLLLAGIGHLREPVPDDHCEHPRGTRARGQPSGALRLVRGAGAGNGRRRVGVDVRRPPPDRGRSRPASGCRTGSSPALVYPAPPDRAR